MKKGGYQKASGGFTIVETLIVLGITGILFTSVVFLVNGRQNTTNFQVAINDLRQQLEQTINETASGYYPGLNNFNCTASGTSLPVITGTPVNAGTTQGTNIGCVFVGKLIRFGAVPGDGPTPSINMTDSTYTVYPLAANRTQTDAATAYAPSGSGGPAPVAIAPGTPVTGVNPTAPVDYTTTDLPGGLTYVGGGSGSSKTNFTPNGLFMMALLSDLNSFAGGQAGNNAIQQLTAHGYSLGSQPVDSLSLADDIPSKIRTPATPPTYFNLCFASGSTNQSGLFSIYGTGSLNVDLQILNGTTC